MKDNLLNWTTLNSIMNEDPVLSTQLFYRPESALKKESTHLTKSLVQKVKSSVYQKATFKQ